MPLIFDRFVGAPSSPTATYYIHVLTALPTGAEATVSALALANPSGYAAANLAVTSSVDGALTSWSFADVVWSPLSWNASIYGMAIVLQIGGSKNPAVDKPFLFYEFENGLRTPIVLTPGYFGLKFSAGSSYPLTTQATSKYEVASFTGFPLYKDLLTLLASNNGTRYTPAGPYVANQCYSSTYSYSFNPDFNCYWIGDRVMARELQNRHDIGYNNVTFPLLRSPVLGFNAAATFNGIDSYVTIGNTTQNGDDFTINNSASAANTGLFLYFFPTLDATEEILLDTTTSNSLGGYIIRKTATNKIEHGFLAAGAPHTLVSFATTNNLDLNAWNLIVISNYQSQRALGLNTVYSSGGVTSDDNIPLNGLRLGARRGLSPTHTGANFTGKILYFTSSKIPRITDVSIINTNRNAQAPYNQAYATGWSQTGLNTATEMLVPNVFEANKSTFLKSVNNLNTYVGAKNLVINEGISAVNINQPDCFYVNFGRNKVRAGTIAIPFFIPNGSYLTVRLDTAPSSAILSIWATNSLPGNTPTNVNLTNPALWDKYELTINNINNTSGLSDITNLPVTVSGGYRFHLVDTGITKYYKYYRIGWKNATSITGGSPSVNHIAHYFLFNSSVLSADLDLVPPTAGYSA